MSAGPPGQAANFKFDGVLETWIQGGAVTQPTLVVSRNNLGWRQFNNIGIDYLYFSVFFGGSSEQFAAHKDEVRILAALLHHVHAFTRHEHHANAF